MAYVYQMPFLSKLNIDKYIRDILNCNILSTVKMTWIILPQMVARKKGIIINISSLSAMRPFPLIAVYSSTKASVDFFSQALDAEYSSHGIIVQSVLPSFVKSGLTTIFCDSFLTRAEAYARSALNTVGLTRKTTGCLSHSIQGCALKWFLPEWLHFSPAGMALQLFLTNLFMKKQK
ncbi:very-long-chain 3-oxoacyl-CoA reductase-like [Hemicordylus capensis]|uniref:very-long-chain 3-oxoacyl-CoA reductase-like n=1 Tax=Hemicordylus capensis TaxID=884348 RepID=UPI002302CFD1|nr:very-long-chain 3-oxoacyl-CoA reductase-like [Hemicordylus capensis]XP_053123212.1 very-long-chain 3-oxoacyl-CoA reductase-like [Hemicordylus capensis]XP_053123213.1 very-long-chain 3-oxoacyl-CoA reductase-like [Hemicordylus capensis]